MFILFTLCGRAGSKGFRNKNLKSFLDIPLVYYSVAAILHFLKNNTIKNCHIDVVLNTDSEELIQVISKQQLLQVEVIRRQESLSGDSISKISVIRDCLIQMEERKKKTYDLVVDLDITSPLRADKDVTEAIQKKLSRKDTDVVFSVAASRRNPYFNMVRREGEFFCKAVSSEFIARQQAPDFYDMNASIYVYSINALRNKNVKVFFNDKCDAIIMKDTGVLDIDSEEDFEFMQVIATYLFDEKYEYKEIFDLAKRMTLSMP